MNDHVTNFYARNSHVIDAFYNRNLIGPCCYPARRHYTPVPVQWAFFFFFTFCNKHCILFWTMADSMISVLTKFYDSYMSTTPKKLKIVDAYLFYILLTGIVQFVYCCLVGTFPFNSFLSGFISCVGSFVLGGKF